MPSIWNSSYKIRRKNFCFLVPCVTVWYQQGKKAYCYRLRFRQYFGAGFIETDLDTAFFLVGHFCPPGSGSGNTGFRNARWATKRQPTSAVLIISTTFAMSPFRDLKRSWIRTKIFRIRAFPRNTISGWCVYPESIKMYVWSLAINKFRQIKNVLTWCDISAAPSATPKA